MPPGRLASMQSLGSRWIRGGLLLPLLAAAVSSVALAVAMARPQTLRVEASDPGARRVLRAFGAPFARSQRTGLWSGPESAIVLHGVGAGEWALALAISGGMPGRPQSFSLVPTGAEGSASVDPVAFQVSPDWREYRVRLTVPNRPPGAAPVQLALATDPYRRSADGSGLGVRVTGLAVAPVGGTVDRLAAAAPVAALWGLALALAAVGTARLVRRISPSARADRVAALVVGVAGLLLSTYAWRDPYGLAWTLPPPVASLVLATLALALTAGGASVAPPGPGRTARIAAAPALALGALVVLYVQRGVLWPAAVLLAVAMGSMVLRLVRERDDLPLPAGARIAPGLWIGMTAVVLVALAMRFTYIRDLPYGLWRDDARYGLVALRMIEDPGYRPAYVPEVVSLPGLGLQLLGLGIRVWGIASWSMRTVPALAGALAVIPLFLLARRLTGRADVALLAAAFLAASSWHVTVSRITSPAAIHPLFELTGLWLLAEGLAVGRTARLRRPWGAVALLAGGAFIGASLQTYHSGRSSPLVAAALVLLTWKAVRAQWRELLWAVAGFAAAGAPLLTYAWNEPSKLNARAGAVFLPVAAAADATPPLAALDASLGRHLLMFNVRGDFNGRRNVPRRPMLDPVTGLGFLLGLFALWRARADGRARFLAAALVLALAPSALAVEGPHSLRAIGAAAFACVIAAFGWHDLARRVPALSPARTASAMVAVVGCALAFNVWTYFVVAPRDERVWGAAYAVETKVGAFVRDRSRGVGPPAGRIYLAREAAAHSVVEFLAHRLPVDTFGSTFSSPPGPDSLFVVARETDRDTLFALAVERGQAPPEIAGFGPPLPDGTRPAFTLYRLP